MNTEEKSQLHQALLGRRDAIADGWYKAITQTSFVPHSEAEVHQHLAELTEEAIALLLTEPFECGRTEAIGSSLANLHHVEPEALGRTQEVLARQLVESLPADQVVALQPRLAALLSGIATGFSQRAREMILAEQERIRGALTRELQRVEDSLRQQRDMAEALEEAASVVSSTLDPDQVLEHILERISRVVPNDAANVMLIKGDRAHIARWRGYERFGAEELISTLEFHTPEIPSLRQMMESREPLVIPDTTTYPGWVPGMGWLRSYGAAPIVVRGEVIGFLNIDSATPGFFDQADAEALRAFAGHAATAIENARLYEAAQREITARKRAEEELRQRNRELTALNAITTTMMQSALDLDEILQLTTDGFVKGLGCNTALIFLLDEEEEEGIFRGGAVSTKAKILERLSAIVGFSLLQIKIPARSDFNETMSNLLAGRITIKHDFYELVKPFWSKLVCSAMQSLLDSKTFLAIPLLVKGKTVGGIVASTREKLSEGDAKTIMTFANQAAIAIDNARLYKAVQQELAERKRAEEELIRLSSAVKTSVDSIVITDVEGKIIDVNEAALKMYGTDNKENLIGQDVLDLIAPENREEGLAGIETVLEKGYDMSRGYEVINKDGCRIPVELSAAAMKDTDGKPMGIVNIARDITERKRTEQELSDREATTRALLNAPTEAATLIDANGIILGANEATAKRFRRSVDELVGLCVYDFFPPALAKSRKTQVEMVFRSGTPIRFEDEREGRFYDNNLYPVFDAEGRVARIAVYSRDITPRKQAEERLLTYQERLRSLASQLSLTEEKERRRIAMALHDRVGQTLAICKIKLGMLRQSASSTKLAELLDEVHKYVEEVIQDTRSLTFELSSPILYQLGLEAALEWLTEQNQERDGIPSEFRDDRQPKPLNDDVRILLFQAVRELLLNVVKHAQAQSVKVAIRRDNNDVQIIVEDDGVGFVPFPIGSHWSEIHGFGLFSIRERLDYLGGQLKIKSKPGHGTQVILVAPLQRDETQQRRK